MLLRRQAEAEWLTAHAKRVSRHKRQSALRLERNHDSKETAARVVKTMRSTAQYVPAT